MYKYSFLLLLLQFSVHIKWCYLYLFLVSVSSSANHATTSVEVGYIWENPRQGENDSTPEVVIDSTKIKSLLRLVCFLSPPLKNENNKNEIVKWERITENKRKPVEGKRYWDDGLTAVGISLEHPSYDIIGEYICSYGQSSKKISVQGLLYWK